MYFSEVNYPKYIFALLGAMYLTSPGDQSHPSNPTDSSGSSICGWFISALTIGIHPPGEASLNLFHRQVIIVISQMALLSKDR